MYQFMANVYCILFPQTGEINMNSFPCHHFLFGLKPVYSIQTRVHMLMVTCWVFQFPCESKWPHFILPHPRKDTLSWPVQTSNVSQLPISHHGDNVVKCGPCGFLHHVKRIWSLKFKKQTSVNIIKGDCKEKYSNLHAISKSNSRQEPL